MGGGVRTYIYCQPPAGGLIRSKVIKCNAYGVAIMKLSYVFYFAGKIMFVLYLSSLYMGEKVKTL